MANFFADPRKRMAVDLQCYLDKGNHLDLEEWRHLGKARLVDEGITQFTYDWVMAHQRFPQVRGLINEIRQAYHDAPKREREKLIADYQRDYERMKKESQEETQKKMIIYLKMHDTPLRDISQIVGKSQKYVAKEIEEMQAQGWCGE